MAEDREHAGTGIRRIDERRAKIIEMIAQGLSTDEISNKLGVSEPLVLRYAIFARVHGMDELRAFPSLVDKSRKVTPMVISKMVEFAICYNIPSFMMGILFKFQNTILRTSIDIRRTIGHALVPKPQLATLPDSVDQAYFAQYVAKHNAGMTPEELLKKYQDGLKLSEDGVEYINARKASDFRRYTRCKRSEIPYFVRKFHEQGMSVSKIASMIGYDTQTVSDYVDFIDIHGFEEAIRCDGVVDPVKRSKYERACMVEFIIAYNYPRYYASLLFKVKDEELRYLYQKRIDLGVPLYGATIARIPDTANVKFITGYISMLNHGKTIEQLKDEYFQTLQEQRTGKAADAMRDELGVSDADAALAASDAAAGAAGAAEADAVASSVDAKGTAARGRGAVGMSGEEERIQELAELKAKEMVEAAQAAHAKAMAEAVEKAWQEGRKAGHEEMKELLSQLYASATEFSGDYADTTMLMKALFDYDAGVSVKEYEQRPVKRGRPPKINVFDPEFEKLDESSKLSQYSRFVSDMRNLIALLHKQREIEIKAVGKTVFEMQTYVDELMVEALKELKQTLPSFNRDLLWSAMGYRDLNFNSKLDSITKRAERNHLLMQQVAEVRTEHQGPMSVSQLNHLLFKKFGKGVSEARLKVLMQSLHILSS